MFILGASGSGDDQGEFERLEEIPLTKCLSQTCPATKYHHKIEQFAKNEGGKERITSQTLLEGHTHPPKHPSLSFSVLNEAAESSSLPAQDTAKDLSACCKVLCAVPDNVHLSK